MKVRNCISVVWHMKGMSLDVDYKFGGYISRLVSMLTAITGRENVNFDITTWAADKYFCVFCIYSVLLVLPYVIKKITNNL